MERKQEVGISSKLRKHFRIVQDSSLKSRLHDPNRLERLQCDVVRWVLQCDVVRWVLQCDVVRWVDSVHVRNKIWSMYQFVLTDSCRYKLICQE